MPNVDVAASCVFLYADTPTANPAEQVTRGDCSNKAALQDLAGHGTHTAGTIAAPINGIGVAGVAPQATIVVLKAGTEQGYFFTQSVVDALRYAGDQRLDVVNMSFFADPWLFNCRNDKEQKAIIKAISDAAQIRPAARRRARRGRRQRGHRPQPSDHRRDQPGLPARRRRLATGQQLVRRPAARRSPVSSWSPRPEPRTCWPGTRPTGTSPT